MGRLTQWYQAQIQQPPIWMKLLGLGVGPLLGYGIGQRRGWAVGIVCIVAMTLAVIPALFWYDRVKEWSRRHPVLDSVAAVVLIFVMLARYAPKVSVLWCLAIAVGGALVLGVNSARVRRARRVDAEAP